MFVIPKIDRIFIDGISEDRKLAGTLEAIVQLARKMHLSTVPKRLKRKRSWILFRASVVTSVRDFILAPQ
ncbi:hypothetical protein ASD28_24185 [Massilia sp. Root133]|jgi:EAL domain-containing protein (putative c-di-GMP-specific phosphodiesterase class I)|nr:hypothetical protein ASD28_24185 [Massilia sp. Root133]KQZ51103.1 hypothetical protein ASD92_20795 [Massilia sp. Root1485]